MSQWWTYELSDFLMFSARTWQRTLELHNRDWFPLQFVATLVAAVMLFALRAKARWAPRCALLALALAWGFVAWSFHWQRYAPINWAAQYFAIGFAVQAVLMAWKAAPGSAAFSMESGSRRGLVGDLLIAGAILYPLLALASGRPPVQTEWFGLMPDPTVLATLGLLLCVRGRRDWLLLPLPLLWCAITGATLWALKSAEWYVMPLAGVLALLAQCRSERRPAVGAADPGAHPGSPVDRKMPASTADTPRPPPRQGH